jgi:hypothetical protein
MLMLKAKGLEGGGVATTIGVKTTGPLSRAAPSKKRHSDQMSRVNQKPIVGGVGGSTIISTQTKLNVSTTDETFPDHTQAETQSACVGSVGGSTKVKVQTSRQVSTTDAIKGEAHA